MVNRHDHQIKKIILLRKVLSEQEIADILLVWGRFKPAAMIELSYFPAARFSRKEFRKKIGDLEKILQKLDLHYRLRINYPKRKKEVTHYSYIARNQKKLKEIIAADKEGNTKKRRLKVGLLLGYPRTAVQAFANGEVLNRLPPHVLKREELKFLNFRLSRHWRRELDYVRKRTKAIKKISPKLYQRILNRLKRNIP